MDFLYVGQGLSQKKGRGSVWRKGFDLLPVPSVKRRAEDWG